MADGDDPGRTGRRAPPVTLLFLSEPPRRKPIAAPGGERAAGLAAHLRAHPRLFAALLAGSALLYVFSNALAAWMPSLFERGFGLSPGFVGSRLGLLILPAALLGNLLSGLAGRWRERSGRRDGVLQVMVAGAVLLVPLAALAPLATTAGAAQAGVALSYFAIALCFGVATAALAAVTPSWLRGRMTALYLMIGNLIGLGIGPPTVGAILDSGFGDPSRVGAALALGGAASVLTGTFLLLLALRWHRRTAARIDDHPVVCVNLADATAYASRLSATTGRRFRLPSNTEREYATRAGTTAANGWSATRSDPCHYGNHSDRSRARAHNAGVADSALYFACDDGFVATAPVASFRPNPWGSTTCSAMSGNERSIAATRISPVHRTPPRRAPPATAARTWIAALHGSTRPNTCASQRSTPI